MSVKLERILRNATTERQKVVWLLRKMIFRNHLLQGPVQPLRTHLHPHCSDFWDLTSRIFQRCRTLIVLFKSEWEHLHNHSDTMAPHVLEYNTNSLYWSNKPTVYSRIIQNKHFAILNTEQTKCYVTATGWQTNCTEYCATVVSVSFCFTFCCVYTVSVLNIVCF